MGASKAITKGIRVEVVSQYLHYQSRPSSAKYFFTYTVRIVNESSETVQLKTRHWIITDADGETREVKGEGVVGEQPTLEPGEAFEYTSGCPLDTSWGTMQGSYQMYLEDGSSFDAEIAPFLLASDSISTVHSLN